VSALVHLLTELLIANQKCKDIAACFTVIVQNLHEINGGFTLQSINGIGNEKSLEYVKKTLSGNSQELSEAVRGFQRSQTLQKIGKSGSLSSVQALELSFESPLVKPGQSGQPGQARLLVQKSLTL